MLHRIFNSAKRHGEESEPDHEVGDLQDFIRIAWSVMAIPQRELAYRRYAHEVADLREDERLHNDMYAAKEHTDLQALVAAARVAAYPDDEDDGLERLRKALRSFDSIQV